MNRKDTKFLGIILVPIVFGLLILTASIFTKGQEKTDDLEYENNDQSVMSGTENYNARGYVKAKDFPQALQNLVASGLLTVDEDTAIDDEDEYVEGDVSSYKSSYECLLDTAEFLKKRTENVVSTLDSESDYMFKIKFDYEKKVFTDETYDTIAKVEQCGFTGFTEQIKRLEKEYQSISRTAMENGQYDLGYRIYNQGVGFEFNELLHGEIEVDLQLNVNSIYIPQKYRNIIETVTQSGEYMLRASSVDTKSEVLTFGAANAVMTRGTGENYEEGTGPDMPVFGDTTISFIFENNQVTGYYVTTNENKLKLTESDKKLIQTVAPGLKLSFPEHPSYTELANKLYIAE